jgi:predicted helicase
MQMTIDRLASFTSWRDLDIHLGKRTSKEKGDDFELLVKYYFSVQPEFYHLYDHVWLFDEVPTLELEKLGLVRQDLGIDIIAKTGEEYHAIQCKYHGDENRSVTFREVSTFLTLYESCNYFRQAFICSNAVSVSPNLQKIGGKETKYLLNDTWANLDKDFLNLLKPSLNRTKLN